MLKRKVLIKEVSYKKNWLVSYEKSLKCLIIMVMLSLTLKKQLEKIKKRDFFEILGVLIYF